MKEYHYTIIAFPDPVTGSYTVTVPSLPGCVAQGRTLDEAVAMAKDAIKLHIRGMIEDGEEVPEENEHPFAVVVKVTA